MNNIIFTVNPFIFSLSVALLIGRTVYKLNCWDQATINLLIGVNIVFPSFILFTIIALYIDQTIYCKTLYWKILYLMELLLALIQITAYPFTTNNMCEHDEEYKYETVMYLNLLILILSSVYILSYLSYILCYSRFCLE